jgi:hypothetical protein
MKYISTKDPLAIAAIEAIRSGKAEVIGQRQCCPESNVSLVAGTLVGPIEQNTEYFRGTRLRDARDGR